MNIVYTNLKIALWTKDKALRSNLEYPLSEHRILDADSAITSDNLSIFLSDHHADFIFLDADMGRKQTLDMLNAISCSDIRVLSVVFLNTPDQKFVSDLRDRGADAVIRKDRIAEQLSDQMSFLLEHKDELHEKSESIIRKLGHVASLFLTHTPKDAIHLLMGYFI